MVELISSDLQKHRELCERILADAGEEHALLEGENKEQLHQLAESKKKVLAELTQSLDKIREHRVAWLKVEPTVRQRHPEITELLRETQNLIMRILVLDRENEQAWLRRGLVPARQIPAARRLQPHLAASLYRRNSYA